MVLNKAATRYAKALLTFAIERNELDTVYQDVIRIQKSIADSRDLAILMNSEVVPEERKVEIYKKIYADKVSAITLNFILLIAKNSRSLIIPHIFNAFIKQYKAHHNIHPVKITTASKMDEELKNELVSFLKAQSENASVEIDEVIDESLIGGFILRTDDHQIDASVSNRLKNMKRELYNTTYTSKL